MFRVSCIVTVIGATILWAAAARSDEVKVRVAVTVDKATIDKALANVAQMRRKQCSDAYLPLRQVINVKMRADEEGKTAFADTKDDNIRMTVEIDVEVVALYRLNQIVYEDGVLRLPELLLLSGYSNLKGERGKATYNPGGFIRLGGWTEEKKQLVHDSLCYRALDEARRVFKEKKDYEKLEAQFAAEFSKEAERLQRARNGKNSEP